MPGQPDDTKQSAKQGGKPGAFEQQLEKLQAIVEALETGDLSLEQSLAKYEQGAALVAACQKELEGAQARLEKTAQDRPD